MRFKVTILAGFFTIVFIATSVVFSASEINLPKELINPGDIYYPVKRGWEKVVLNFHFGNKAKRDYYNGLSKVRLSELKSIAEGNLLDQFETGSQRFSFTVGKLVEFANLENNQEFNENLASDFLSYEKILEDLKSKVKTDSSFLMLLDHNINTLKLLSDRISK